MSRDLEKGNLLGLGIPAKRKKIIILVINQETEKENYILIGDTTKNSASYPTQSFQALLLKGIL